MVDPVSDERLLQRFVRGERGALGELADRYERALLGLARGLCDGDEAAARDVVQEAWLRVIKYGGSFDSRSSVRTWLYRVVINRSHDWRTARRREGTGTRDAEALSVIPTHEQKESATELNGTLRAAMDRLSASSRLVVLLCYHHALTHEQAAEVLGVPLGTVKSRLHAALGVLRGALREEGRR